MGLLVGGVLVWTLSHYFKRLFPATRAKLGAPGKGLVTVLLLLSLAMMVYGYRWTEFTPVWTPPSFMVHINNLLMVTALYVFGMSATTGRLRGRMRHPMLLSVKIWALAHLLVNGDLASIILFGGMLVWAAGSVILINKAEVWDRPTSGDAKKDKLLAIITVVAFAAMTGIHTWLGVWPFPG
ncbi:MAG: NnrU family protein [Marinovum sp.]|nr:NnrU family protein [Marinovum sp.]